MTTVAVFGSSRTYPGDADYTLTYEVGKALGEAGYSVMTGGYEGVMAAASHGAADANAEVIGVTSLPIERLRNVQANQWVDQVVPYETLRDRLMHLILHADAYVVMPGGLGTLCELVLSWELMRVNDTTPRPLVCVGDYWQAILEPLRQQTNGYITPNTWDYIHFAHTPQEVVEFIQKGL